MSTSTKQAEITTGSYRFDYPRISDQFTVNQAQEFAKGSNITSVTREIRIDAPGEKVWAILADIGSVQDYSPGVVKSYYTSDIKVGVGASRHCDLFPTGTVEEQIVSWRDREQFIETGEVVTREVFKRIKESVGVKNE